MGIRDRPTAARSPWQNGYCERLIGSIRRECLDHIVIFGERHLRYVLYSYAHYYNLMPGHVLLLSKDLFLSAARYRLLIVINPFHSLADSITNTFGFDLR